MKKRGEASKGLRHPPPFPPSRPCNRSLHLGKNGGGKVGKQTMNFRAKISSGPALGASPSGSGCKVIDGETLPRPPGQMPRVGRQTGAFFLLRILRSQPPAAQRLPSAAQGGSAKGALGPHGPADGARRFQRKEPLHLGGGSGWGSSSAAECPVCQTGSWGLSRAPQVQCPLGLFLPWAPDDRISHAAQSAETS